MGARRGLFLRYNFASFFEKKCPEVLRNQKKGLPLHPRSREGHPEGCRGVHWQGRRRFRFWDFFRFFFEKSFGSPEKRLTFAAPLKEGPASRPEALWRQPPWGAVLRFFPREKILKKVLEIRKKGLPLHSRSKGRWREDHWKDWEKYKKASTENKIKREASIPVPAEMPGWMKKRQDSLEI